MQQSQQLLTLDGSARHKPKASTPEWTLHVGNCEEVLRTMPACSVDAVVTDPPYGIHFMENSWDNFGSNELQGLREFQKWTTHWAQRVALVTKPGANWLVFGSPRTYHRLACGLEDAGIRVITCLMWFYGEGMIKTRELAQGVRGDLKPAYEPILLARSPSTQTASATYHRHGTGGINIDACLIDGEQGSGHWSGDDGSDSTSTPGYDGGFTQGGRRRGGRVPANVMLDPAAAAALDDAAGLRRSGAAPTTRHSSKHSSRVYSGKFEGRTECGPGRGASAAGPSRFYYCSKAAAHDRNQGLGKEPIDNTHPCVKPTDLMRWLVRLATPPECTVIDPFTGSGSTGVASLLENRSFIGIERDASQARTARARLGNGNKEQAAVA